MKRAALILAYLIAGLGSVSRSDAQVSPSPTSSATPHQLKQRDVGIRPLGFSANVATNLPTEIDFDKNAAGKDSYTEFSFTTQPNSKNETLMSSSGDYVLFDETKRRHITHKVQQAAADSGTEYEIYRGYDDARTACWHFDPTKFERIDGGSGPLHIIAPLLGVQTQVRLLVTKNDVDCI